eukprot:s564_g10.t1
MLKAEPAAKAVPPPAPAGNVPAKPAAKPKAPKPVAVKAKATLPDAAAVGQSDNAYPKPKAKGTNAVQPPPPKEKQQPVPKSQPAVQAPASPANAAPKQAKQPDPQLAKALPKPPAKAPAKAAKSEPLQPPKKQPPVKAPAKAELPPKAMASEAQPKALAPKQPVKANEFPQNQTQPINQPPKVPPKKSSGAPGPGNSPIQKAPGKAEGPPNGDATNVGPPKAKQGDHGDQLMPPKAKPAKAPAKAKVKAQPAQPPKAQVEAPLAPLDAAAPESTLPKASPENSPRNDLQTEPKAERLEDVQETQGAGDASNHEKQVREQIDLDLPRTFPNTPEVDSRRATIRNVLLTYSRSNPHIGYCQGMSFPAAVLCANLSESAANARFQSCLEKVRELWLPGFHIFETVKQAFDALLAHQSQALAQSFQAQDVILDVFLLDAWLTMFARWLPFKMLFRVLDFVESEGFSGVLSLTVAVVNSHGQSIVGVEKADAMLQLWKCLQWDVSEPPLEELLEVAKGMLPKARELLAEQCTMSRPVKDVVGLAFERQGPQILHVDTGADILDLLSQESWEKWKAQAEKFRKATPVDPSDKSEKDTKGKNSFLSIFRCGRARTDSDDLPPKPKVGMDTE